MKKITSLLMVFVLMPFMVLGATLKIGDEIFSPSEKNGYSYTFTSCSAVASYSEAGGFKLTFPMSVAIADDISWMMGAGLSITINSGATVALSGSITSTSGGVLEINGPGRLQIINGRISPYYADIKFFGAIVEMTANDNGSPPIGTYCSIEANLSILSIACFQKGLYAEDGVKLRASMISILAQGSQHGDILDRGAIQSAGDISICGCAVAVVQQHSAGSRPSEGICTSGGDKQLSVIDSCVTIVSEGNSLNACRVACSNSRTLLISLSAPAVSSRNNADSDNRKVFFGDGKYVLCSALEKCGVCAGRVEIDGGELEICSPDGIGTYSWEFLMKDGSLKMVDKVSNKLMKQEILAESVVMGVAGAYFKEWTSAHTGFLASILTKLDGAIFDDPQGIADSMVTSRRFCQLGGKMVQGSAKHGYLARDYLLGTSVKPRLTPAFIGDSFNGDFGYYYGDYYDMAPTNTFGQTLTHVSYAPYWVYTGTGEEPVVPTGYYRICFVAESRGEPVSLLCQPGHVYRLPTYTATPPAGKKFAGWRCLRTGKRYDDQLLVFNLGQSCETVTMMAIWE